MAEFKYEIIKHIAVLSENSNGWKKELNFVSWNGLPPKYDIRDWGPGDAERKIGKGVTLKKEEIEALKNVLLNLEQ